MAGRRLNAAEAALWERVAKSVRAIHPAALHDIESKMASPLPSRTAAVNQHRTIGEATVGAKSTQFLNTLDGSWDKKLDTGRIRPDRSIDLHGYNLAAAHHRLERGLDEAVRDGARVILLITGRAPRPGTSRLDLPLRGIIRESVRDWLSASRHSCSIAAVRNAHPRHGGAGALYIILRRPR
jgi:DNA-nicking Smr family endonuclease